MQNSNNNDLNNLNKNKSNSFILKDYFKRINITKSMLKFIDKFNKGGNLENENK